MFRFCDSFFISRLRRFFSLIFRYPFYKLIFGKFTWRSLINSPMKIDGGKNIFISERVIIHYKTWLAAVPLSGNICRLEIGKGTVIGNFNHIYATKSIVIEENVLTADKVYISDNLHGYSDINLPIMHQPIQQKGDVVIGAGSWLGENVCVIGAKIGRNCVVGANSVVTKNIPDYCVVVGAPAKIIKRYCQISQSWEKTTPDGEFIN